MLPQALRLLVQERLELVPGKAMLAKGTASRLVLVLETAQRLVPALGTPPRLAPVLETAQRLVPALGTPPAMGTAPRLVPVLETAQRLVPALGTARRLVLALETALQTALGQNLAQEMAPQLVPVPVGRQAAKPQGQHPAPNLQAALAQGQGMA